MKERTFSVVVCTDGRLPFLKTALQSLRALDYRGYEVCVVCGPTRDGAREFAAAFTPPPKIADCPTRNLSRARNIGIAMAAGEIVAFIDDDAAPEAEWLSDLNAAYEDPEVTAAGGIVYDASGLSLQSRFVTVDRLGYAHPHWSGPTGRLNFPYSPEFPHLLGANCSFRRTTLVALGGFDEEYEYFLDETDLIARVNDSGGRIAQLRRAAVHHKYAPSVSRDAGLNVRHWRAHIKNRIYFGLRNGARHHNPLEATRAALDDAEQWRAEIARKIELGEMNNADLQRFHEEAESGLVAGLAAAREPQRKLMTAAARAAVPPPLQPWARGQGERLCLALVTQDYPPRQNGGIARNVAELARAFADFGHHVHVFTRAREKPSLGFEDGAWVHRVEIAAGPPPPDLVAPETIPGPIWDYSRTMWEEVAKLDARRPVDLVYAPLWDCEPVAFLHKPRFPLVCALQTTMDFWLDSQPRHRADREWMATRGAPLLALERWILQRAPLMHANSRAIVDDIARRYELAFPRERLIFAPHGLSDWAPEGRTAADRPGVRFLFVGRLESRKGIDTLLAAAPEALRRHPEARLDIVGDDAIERDDGGTYRAAFLARNDVADLSDRIAFHGRVEEEALRRHYRDCDVLIAPSRYESFGLVYAEGMMFAKPVIGGRGGGGGEVIVDGETGLLVSPGDVAGLAAAMERLAADSALRAAMGAAGRRRYETHFRVEIAARQLLDGALARLPGRLRVSAQKSG